MTGLLSKIAKGANKFSDELLMPTTGLGKLGAYLGAASGTDLGLAAMAAMKDARQNPDIELERQIKQAQLERLQRPPAAPMNDTERDYAFWKEKLTPQQFEAWVSNRVNPLMGVQVFNPATGNTELQFVPRSGNMGGGGPASATPGGASPPSTLPPDFDFNQGGPAPKAPAGFR